MRIQVNPELHSNGFNALRRIVRTEGPIAIFKGVIPPIVLRGSAYAALFATYGAARREIAPWNLGQYTEVYVAGSVAGIVGSMVDSPVELIKLQLQNAGQGRPTSSTDLNRSIYIIDIISSIKRHDQIWREFCKFEIF